jgi:hypothetical protein
VIIGGSYTVTVRTSETSVDNHFTRQYNPEDSSEHHTRRRENLKSNKVATNLAGLVTSSLGPDATRGQSVVHAILCAQYYYRL